MTDELQRQREDSLPRANHRALVSLQGWTSTAVYVRKRSCKFFFFFIYLFIFFPVCNMLLFFQANLQPQHAICPNKLWEIIMKSTLFVLHDSAQTYTHYMKALCDSFPVTEWGGYLYKSVQKKKKKKTAGLPIFMLIETKFPFTGWSAQMTVHSCNG